MSPELQQILTQVLVALAGTTLLWRWAAPWLRAEKSTGCSTGCGQCPLNKEHDKTLAGMQLIQIQLPGKSTTRRI
jgi:hypothetical protein